MTSEQSSRLRAKIAKCTVKAQVETSCAKLRLYKNDDLLDPTKYSAPEFDKYDFDNIGELPLSYKDHHDVHFNVGIVGGGMSGLYASLILEDLGLGHEVIEASQRVGGRVWSHHFSEKDGDYYEVGAMLFPDIPIMARTARLLEYLDITKDTTKNPQQGSLIPFYHEGPNNPKFFNVIHSGAIATENNQLRPQDEVKGTDIFNISIKNGGMVPKRLVYLTAPSPRNTSTNIILIASYSEASRIS